MIELKLAGDMQPIPNFQTFLQELQMKNEISEESYYKFKKVLEKQNHTTYTTEEIKEIGDDLMAFYELLAEFDNEGVAKE